MKKDNETCVQRAKFYFHYFEKKEWLPSEQPVLDEIVNNKNLRPEAIRNFNKSLSVRLDRIANMMEILLKAHEDWAITGKKDQVIMETESFEFNQALEILHQYGFHDDEFILKIDYTRKWGVL